MIPHVGHILYWLFYRKRKKVIYLCPNCDYENPPILSPGEARKILGEYNFKMILESQQKQHWFTRSLTPAILIFLLILAYLLWRLRVKG